MVVLSSCGTSSPRLTGAVDGGLPQAFLLAGANRVVSSIWEVDDLGASAMFRHFYMAARQAEVAEALRMAQLAMLRDSAWGPATAGVWGAFRVERGEIARSRPSQ